jgi:DNA-binding Lrp family transcriptional regulator
MRVLNQRTTEGLIQMLSDDYSRRIVISAIPKAKSVEDFSKENDVPLSTCYRRVHELLSQGILVVEKIVVTPDGKKYELLRSAFKDIKIDFENGQIAIDATVNEDISDKLYNMWVSMREPV